MNNLSTYFDFIYKQGLWGAQYSSGQGSHWPPLVNAYVDCFRTFLREEIVSSDPTIIDIGCGDFNIGKNFIDDCKQLIGIDVSQSIININKDKYQFKNIHFLCLDARKDKLPDGDIAILRQVLQHLDNRSISEILENIKRTSCSWLIVTEHIPACTFDANQDIPKASANIRLNIKSGIDIEKSPFNICALEKQLLLSYYGFGGIIQTIAYRIK